MTELRLMVIKHSGIISRYYIDYVAGYDAPLLDETLAKFIDTSGLNENEDLLIRSILESVSNIKCK